MLKNDDRKNDPMQRPNLFKGVPKSSLLKYVWLVVIVVVASLYYHYKG